MDLTDDETVVLVKLFCVVVVGSVTFEADVLSIIKVVVLFGDVDGFVVVAAVSVDATGVIETVAGVVVDVVVETVGVVVGACDVFGVVSFTNIMRFGFSSKCA